LSAFHLPAAGEAAFFEILDETTAFNRHSNLDRYLFQQGATGRDLFILLLACHDHLMQRVLEHFPARLNRFPFGDHLRPFDQLSHVAGADFCIFGGIGP
jgi:hypothetical protein